MQNKTFKAGSALHVKERKKLQGEHQPSMIGFTLILPAICIQDKYKCTD